LTVSYNLTYFINCENTQFANIYCKFIQYVLRKNIHGKKIKKKIVVVAKIVYGS